MDKQMIEEMARIIAFELCPNRAIHKKWGEEAQCYSDNNFAECKEIKNVVDKLYNAGYRKIPENAVVLMGDEYERWQGQTLNIKKIRKETAEKLAEKTNQAINAYRKKVGEDEYVVDARRLIFEVNEICKEFTGEKL